MGRTRSHVSLQEMFREQISWFYVLEQGFVPSGLLTDMSVKQATELGI